jgi:hypothetical protein
MSPSVSGTLQTGTYTIVNVQNKLNVVLGGSSQKNGPIVSRPDPTSDYAKVGPSPERMSMRYDRETDRHDFLSPITIMIVERDPSSQRQLQHLQLRCSDSCCYYSSWRRCRVFCQNSRDQGSALDDLRDFYQRELHVCSRNFTRRL